MYRFQCGFRTARVFKRPWILQELPSELGVEQGSRASTHNQDISLLQKRPLVTVSFSSPAHYFPRDMPPFFPSSFSHDPAVYIALPSFCQVCQLLRSHPLLLDPQPLASLHFSKSHLAPLSLVPQQ